MEQETYLDRYRVCRDDDGSALELVSGAGTTAYKALDTTSGREVMLWVLPVGKLRSTVREKLEAKALAAKQVNHLNVPALCDFGFAGDEFVYVTEYVDGTSARAWVTEHGPMPIGAVLRIAAQMVGAIGAANFYGIVHRALHPGNVILVPGQTSEGEWPLIKVVNFLGRAPSFIATETSGSDLHEPFRYASPEQLQDGKVDFRSEVYSLGCTLWFLLTGAPPFAGAVTVENAPGVPGGVKELIGQMLAADPGERQFDPTTLQEQIENCTAQIVRRDALASKVGMAPASLAAEPDVTQGPTRGRFPWKPLALAALLLVAVALAALALPRSLRPDRLFTRGPAPLGVPIGIPDPPPAPPAVDPAVASVPSRTSTGSPPVLVSTASADDDADSSTDSPEVAANGASADSPPSAGRDALQSAAKVADNVPVSAQVSEPPAPAEGPAESSAPPTGLTQEPTSLAEAGNVGEPSSAATSLEPTSSPRAVSRQPATPVINSGAAKSFAVAKPKKRSNGPPHYASSPADDGMPQRRPHVARVQYLGTTPNGELVFGVPSSEEVFVAPEIVRSERRRPRGRRVIRESIDGFPVLPALPPDE